MHNWDLQLNDAILLLSMDGNVLFLVSYIFIVVCSVSHHFIEKIFYFRANDKNNYVF